MSPSRIDAAAKLDRTQCYIQLKAENIDEEVRWQFANRDTAAQFLLRCAKSGHCDERENPAQLFIVV